MTTLVEFLLSRIAEDEAAASLKHSEMQDMGGGAAYVPPGSSYDPRVLARCKATRQIVERHAQSAAFGCGICSEYRREHVETCDEMRMLATVYADHPDYREEWRP